MADLKQLNIVKDLASKKEQQALQTLSAAQSQIRQLEQQKESLVQYKLDYMQQIIDTGNLGVTADKLMLLQGFLAKIDSSISQQTDIIARSQLAVDARQAQWRQARQYLDSIEFLINKQRQEIAEKEEKQQQKLSDEFAMMSHYRKLKASR